MRKAMGPGSPSDSPSLSANRNVTWDINEGTDSPLRQPTFGMTNFVSDYEESEKDKTVSNEEMESMGQVYGGTSLEQQSPRREKCVEGSE
ncbi:hypothetical protein L2E82_06428 [Cichorium intybus]|uniref:Uncharacterized protein n=1 Tax=Cichorium intybus TaxID=13427 RepID=A0ACB9HAL7_CICIN|nr:hypothetical protein L2E82_06428 [Cichorium intybus]